MSLLTIPNELQSDIFSLLPRRDLFNVTQTSHHLHDVSIRILYEKVALNRWDHLHAFFIPPVGRDVREGRRVELDSIGELRIYVKSHFTPTNTLQLLLPIPLHLKRTPLLLPVLRVKAARPSPLAPLLAFLESQDFQILDPDSLLWSQQASPRSFAQETLRNHLDSAVGRLHPFCRPKVVEFIMEREPDDVACAIYVESRRRELVMAAVERLHRWIDQEGLATIHSLPNEILSQILSYLPKSALSTCLTVDQRIHDVAIPFLYSKVIITRWSKLESFFLPGEIIPAGTELAVRHAERRRKEWDSIRELSMRFEKVRTSTTCFWRWREPEWEYDIPEYGFFGPATTVFGPVPLSLKTKPLVLRNLEVLYPSHPRSARLGTFECDPAPLLPLLSYIESNTFVLTTTSSVVGDPSQVIDKSVAQLIEKTVREGLKRSVDRYHPFCSSSIIESFLRFDPEDALLAAKGPFERFESKLIEASEILHQSIADAGYATFSDLPSDLKSSIFAFLSLSTLTSTARVSKGFHSATLPILYSVVTLRNWKHIEIFFFDPPSLPSTNPDIVAARIKNRRSELRLVRHLVLDFRSGYGEGGSLPDFDASPSSPSSYLSINPLLLSQLTIIHLDLLDSLLPILPWLNPSSLAVQSLGGGFSSNDAEEEEGDPTWRTLLSLRCWDRITHVDLGVQHGHPVAFLPEELVASSPFRTATSGVLALVGGVGGAVASYRPTLVSLFDSVCPSLRSVKVVCTGSKGVKKGVRKMLDDQGWGRKWESLEVEVRGGLKAGKATK
ncbi:hypothetical protein BDY24DRAFT_440879 [Mrakia frigida]|uniref:uncharacterized protein n=1 Tax=Mrakia frigida TaxID=29902 RepID=UPI003FCC0483